MKKSFYSPFSGYNVCLPKYKLVVSKEAVARAEKNNQISRHNDWLPPQIGSTHRYSLKIQNLSTFSTQNKEEQSIWV